MESTKVKGRKKDKILSYCKAALVELKYDISDIVGKSRDREICDIRTILCFTLISENLSQEDISTFINYRERSTVSYQKKNAKNLIDTNARFRIRLNVFLETYGRKKSESDQSRHFCYPKAFRV